MARRPLIAIPARFSESASALRYRADVLPRTLMTAVLAAGGEPLAVHPTGGADVDDQVAQRLEFADGIVLPGGGDLDARWTAQASHPTLYDVDVEQDEFDLAVARHALVSGIPLLAICRGLQVVNVARGGDLVQDMSESTGHHRDLTHPVTTQAGSLLHAAIGARVEVSCFHHQSLRRLGETMTPVAWAEDGTTEAVELSQSPGWFLGLQWHPEDTAATDGAQAALFAAHVVAAAQFRSRESPNR
ncbi:gamma-glutamyl-gamma-aminobutyrate hydrolase family protein [Aeromicrobium sp. CF3.5]|uniref:gamma-glutamyl-gamma-aminobutyrate hydrolase family protein n=1 Tax=Aeromicrobium sp. CF3.5 TaxID=3373078 RepID=UPI003EE4A7B3